MEISDDDDTQAMLELYPTVNSIELYVKKNTVSHRMHEGRGIHIYPRFG